jgi:hypothetical protein
LETVWGKAFFRKLALALQRQFERVGKIRFGLFDGFALRNHGSEDPPLHAGSKTAVNFIALDYHTRLPRAAAP